ncbi:GerAB/ArcD/ProY family transporter [Metabacillus litoralis]|uniref:GerAB/ArcD/ProY family transporter n=1 Tax=Metabacillus litoralis TaxID=152268 RepID=UPI0013CEC546|nr:GerAB/ArcD/ProY family transporter [Metabacillus litoralis]MCM3160116.1 GerAB/ArcD/ProY family transporter [Metabacillus litoralis]MCM3408701.1 GerAB/ArcD/ProY family transporter [Metabacillus litoralis]
MSKRFIYVMLILNMLTNIVAYVPMVLIENRSNGSVLAMVLSLPIGIFIIFLFTKYMSKFPYMGLPEILDKFAPKWFRLFFLVIQGVLWYVAGLVTLVAFTNISKQYINPDMDELLIMLAFLIVIVFGATLPSKKVLYATEIILLLNLPFIAFIIFKSYFNHDLMWDSVRIAVTHFQKIPSFESISTATFVYTGYTNLVIFNRLYKDVRVKYLWAIAILGFFTLITTFIIPIGLNGFDGAESFTFPWIATTEAIRIELGFIERISFLFLGLYINVSLASVILHWHVGLELLKAAFPSFKFKKIDMKPLVLIGVFTVLALVVQLFFEEKTVGEIAKVWMMLLLPAQIAGLVLLKLLSKRKEKLSK